MGRFGLGNKSALSLGIESFTVVNRYNGKLFMFDVSLHNVTSSTPKFSKGKKNDFIEVEVPQPTEDGGTELKKFTFYYEATEDKNGPEVRVPIKKHMKKKIFEAIESQLLYLPGVIFKHKTQQDYEPKDVEISAEILYKDENIIISKSRVFDSPHILLGTGDGLISYGINMPA